MSDTPTTMRGIMFMDEASDYHKWHMHRKQKEIWDRLISRERKDGLLAIDYTYDWMRYALPMDWMATTTTVTQQKQEEKMGFFKKIKWMYENVGKLKKQMDDVELVCGGLVQDIEDVNKKLEALDKRVGKSRYNGLHFGLLFGEESKEKSLYQRISKLEQSQHPDNNELSEKVNAIARHLEMEFEHKSVIESELNEYELVEPTEEEDEDYE